MTAKVLLFKPTLSVSETLRNIADAIDSGELSGDSMTCVIDLEIFSAGNFKESDAIFRTTFDLQYAMHKLMTLTHQCECYE